MSKTLLIDGQLFQTGTWDRGMGKYSLDLLNSMSQSGQFESYARVVLLLNKEIGISNNRLEVLTGIYDKFQFVELGFKNRHNIMDIPRCMLANRSMLDAYIDNNFRSEDIDFFMLSLFEGDLAVPVFPSNVSKKVLLFYDLIPYLFADEYLKFDQPRQNYLERFSVIFEADIIMTISQTTHDDLVSHFGMPSERVFNIDGAPIQLQRGRLKPKKPKLVTDKPFILLPSGNDIRKNNLRAVEAFNIFNEKQNRRYSLLITSHFDDEIRQELKKISSDIEFTGNVNESEIQWLFENAETVFFPPLYEGLGLPILEAIETKRVIACSKIPVFFEMSTNGFYYFDPYDVVQIADALEKAALGNIDSEEYARVLEKYRWSRTGDLCKRAFSHAVNKNRENIPKIAIVGPTPAGKSGIGKVIQHLHPELSLVADVEYYLEDNGSGATKPMYLDKISKVHNVTDFNLDSYKKFDGVFYHIGNSDYHNHTFLLATRYPGHAIFHDTHLDGLMNTLRNNGLMNDVRYELEQQLMSEASSSAASYVGSIVNNQLSVSAHSNYAIKGLKESAHKKSSHTFTKIDLPVSEVVEDYRADVTQAVIGVAGILHSTKGLKMIEELARDEEFKDVQFLLFGYGFGISDGELAGLRSLANVEIITDVSDLQFSLLLNKVDIMVNYRPVYNGESSYVTLEAMRSGAAVVVRDIGWFAELNNSSVQKVHDESGVRAAIVDLLSKPEKIRELGRSARKEVGSKHTMKNYAKKLTDLLENVQSSGFPVQTSKILKESNDSDSAVKQIIQNLGSKD